MSILESERMYPPTNEKSPAQDRETPAVKDEVWSPEHVIDGTSATCIALAVKCAPIRAMHRVRETFMNCP
jgi:hypothetical protein